MRTVLITGGSRGIGKAIAEKFLSNNYKVIAPSRDELDLSSNKSIENFININRDIYFDIIINNAGINEINLIENVTDTEIDEMIKINLIAPIKILREFTKEMKKRNFGRIVNLGSIWAVVAKEGRSIYSSTKNGLHGITNTLAIELGQYNVLVNTVCPGFTLTELTKKNNSLEEIMEISKQIPLKRMAEPKEIAEIVFFLCSDSNTYLTGQKIVVDGGFTIK